MAKYKVVFVEWIDSTASSDWTELEEIDLKKESSSCNSIGFLVSENKKIIAVAGSYDSSTKSINNYIFIPKAAIIKMKVIKI